MEARVGRIYGDYFITATKLKYFIPKEVIELLYNMVGGRVLYKDMDKQRGI